MRKGFLMVLAVVLVAAMAAPAMAEVSLTGFIRSTAYMSNYERYTGSEVFPVKWDGPRASSATNPLAGALVSVFTEGLPSSALVGSVPTFGPYGEFTYAVPAPLQGGTVFANTNAPTSGYVESRARLRFEAKAENVGAVAFFEIDGRWGDIQYANGIRNAGFGTEADTINLETKDVYVWFKPAASTVLNVGLMNVTDAFQGVIFGAMDAAGILGVSKIEPVELRYGWFVLKNDAQVTFVGGASGPSTVNTKTTAADLLILEAHAMPTKESRIGLDVYFLNDRAYNGPPAATTITGTATSLTQSRIGYQSAQVWTIGLDGNIMFTPMFNLSGFVFFQTGKIKQVQDNTTDIVTFNPNVQGWSGDLRLDIAPKEYGKGFIEYIYVSGQKEDNDNYTGIWNASNYANAGALYNRPDLEIILPNPWDTNTSQALIYDPKGPNAFNHGLGLGMSVVSAGWSIPFAEKWLAKVGFGWAQTAEKFKTSLTSTGTSYFSNKDLGTEVNARITYNILKGLDLQGAGAYCWLGNAYNPGDLTTFINPISTPGVSLSKADNLYKLYARLNYAF